MAYIFQQDELPRLLSVKPGRERVFFVSKELTHMDDMLAGIMYYNKGASSPYHMHKNCEHFYFIFEGRGTVETPEKTTEVGPGDLIFFPAEDEHRLRATEPLFLPGGLSGFLTNFFLTSALIFVPWTGVEKIAAINTRDLLHFRHHNRFDELNRSW